jgi:hypothetical protein
MVTPAGEEEERELRPRMWRVLRGVELVALRRKQRLNIRQVFDPAAIGGELGRGGLVAVVGFWNGDSAGLADELRAVLGPEFDVISSRGSIRIE